MGFSDYSQSPKPFWSHPNYKGYDAIAGKEKPWQMVFGRKTLPCIHCQKKFERFEYLLQHHRAVHNELPNPVHP